MTFIPDRNIGLPEPWFWHDGNLEIQLQKELCVGHVLEGRKLKTLARREDCDDVLFELLDQPGRYAVVHMTFASRSNAHSGFPRTKLYDSWVALYSERILQDNSEWEKNQ